MKLKTSHQRLWLFTLAEQFRPGRVMLFIGIVLYTLVVLVLGAYVHSSGLYLEVKPFLTENVGLIPRMVRGAFANPERITIDIKYEDYMTIAEKRQIALREGILISSDADFVPATIRYGDKNINVRLRLKGDLRDHWDGDKWSFRIKVRGDDTLFGMKEFSIQHPKTRSYLYEWLYFQALDREDLLALRYKFINVTINGKDMGIYALEEHFDKHLVENNQLREGPIVRFNEDLCWSDILQQAQFLGGLEVFCAHYGSGSYLSSEADGFQTQRWLEDPINRTQYIQAINLLESFRRGELSTSEVFDVEKLAKFFAITDLMNAVHAANWRNIRFYFNPITSRLEPIGFDADIGIEPMLIKELSAFRSILNPNRDNAYFYHYYYFDSIFDDQIFYEEYIKQLERVSKSSYLDDLLADLEEDIGENLDIIYREFPGFNFSTDSFYQKQELIRTVLDPTKGIHAYFRRSSRDAIQLELGNIQYLPVQVISVTYQGTTQFQPESEVILRGRDPSQSVDFQAEAFNLPEGFIWSDAMLPDLKVNYQILGASNINSVAISENNHYVDDFSENDFIRQPSNVDSFDFLVTDESTNRIIIKPGEWNLDSSLIIPSGFIVVSGPGTKLNLSNSANILSYSPLMFLGSEDDPIVIQSEDATGQGIVVIGADEGSVLERVIFQNLSNPSQPGWELTGAVTFYESPVEISHAQFIENRSEDALNIIRTDFTINTSLFSHTFSDAFDADFTTGKVTDSSFISSGNDAFDVSGSVVEMADIFIDGAGDKGISVGEMSRVTAERIDISSAMIGVASKDLSKLTIKNLEVRESQIGITAYQKKSEFGPGTIDAAIVKISETDIPYLVEVGSTVQVDGEIIEANQEDVFNTIYGQQ